MLGYSNPDFIETMKKQIDSLYFLVTGTAQSPLGVELAEKMNKYIPSAEMVRYLLSGTEAVQLAIRLARAYTKGKYFIRFEGHYHGSMDNVLGGAVNRDPNGLPFAVENSENIYPSEGKDPHAIQQSFLLPWNNIAILKDVLKKYGEDVGLIMMEPICCNGGCCPPRPGYLESIPDFVMNME